MVRASWIWRTLFGLTLARWTTTASAAKRAPVGDSKIRDSAGVAK